MRSLLRSEGSWAYRAMLLVSVFAVALGVSARVYHLGFPSRILWDEKYFPDGDRFDIDREGGYHLPFGHSIHFCLGAPLARIEVQAVVGADDEGGGPPGAVSVDDLEDSAQPVIDHRELGAVLRPQPAAEAARAARHRPAARIAGQRLGEVVEALGQLPHRRGIGARVSVVYRGGMSFRENNGGGGGEDKSQGSEPLHFGIGTAGQAGVKVFGPSGAIDTVRGVAANSTITVVEGSTR